MKEGYRQQARALVQLLLEVLQGVLRLVQVQEQRVLPLQGERLLRLVVLLELLPLVQVRGRLYEFTTAFYQMLVTNPTVVAKDF